MIHPHKCTNKTVTHTFLYTHLRNNKNQQQEKLAFMWLLQRRCGWEGVCSDPAGGASNAEDASGSMTAAGKGHDMICQKAVSLIVDLCTQDSPRLDHNTCEEFLFLISNQENNHKDSGNDQTFPLDLWFCCLWSGLCCYWWCFSEWESDLKQKWFNFGSGTTVKQSQAGIKLKITYSQDSITHGLTAFLCGL